MNYRAPPAFSLSTSLKRSISEMPKREHASPGPIYDHQKSGMMSLKRSFSIGKSQRMAINHGVENTPSPHHYKIKAHPNKLPITFPKSNPVNPESDIPPVGSHYPDHTFTQPKLPIYSMGSKYESILTNTNQNPGPGTYQINNQSLPILSKSKNKSQNKFGSASRFKYQKDSTPGVGNYSIETVSKLMNKKTSLPQDQKFKSSKQILPGPGEYLVRSQFSEKGQKGKSLSSRFKSPFELKNDTTMAFGKYFQKQGSMAFLQKNIKFSFPKQKRQEKPKDNIPAPTEYIIDEYQPKNSCGVIMPQSQRKEYNDTLEFPGPGSYHIKNDTGSMPVFGRSKSIELISDTPGAGRYEPKIVQRKHRGVVFGSQRKGVLKMNSTGAVGAYQLSQTILSKKGSFSKSERFAHPIQRQPGPGDYHIHDIINYHITSKQSSFKNL